MKFFSAAILFATVSNVAAFSAVAPSATGSTTGNPDPVDKSMRGIDKEPSTFDPTAGENPALTRNNIDQVWVPQVRIRGVKTVNVRFPASNSQGNKNRSQQTF
jgi:hypothetical protein